MLLPPDGVGDGVMFSCCPVHPFVYTVRILLAQYLMNGLNSFNKTDGMNIYKPQMMTWLDCGGHGHSTPSVKSCEHHIS